jgi:TP901 family phage tail tape measure protein
MSDGRVVIDIDADDKQFRAVLSSLGKTAAAGIALLTAAVVGFGVAGLKAATDFNKGMANVASLMPGNIDRVNELKGAVQDMAVEFGKSTDDLAGGLYQVVSAFGDTADTVKILEVNTKAATAGLASTTDAINLTSAVTKAYGDTSAEAVQRASDLALMTVRLGQTTFPELAASIGRVTPLTNELGVSQEELFATMATFTGVTGGAAEVSTQLRGVLQSLLAPTDAATAAIQAAGYADAEAMLAKEGLAGSVKILTDAAEASGQPLQDYIGSIEGQTLALALAGPQADIYTEKLAAMGQAAGATDAAFDEQTVGINALGFAFEQIQQVGTTALQMLGDAIGAAFGPDIIASVGTFKDALYGIVGGLSAILEGSRGMSKLDILQGFDPATAAQQLQDGISKLVGLLASGIQALVPPLVAAVAGLIVAVAKAVPGLIPVLVDAVLDGVLQIAAALPAIIPALVGAVVNALVTVVLALVQALPSVLTGIIQAIVAAVPLIIEAAVTLLSGIAQAFPVVIPALITALIEGIDTLLQTLPTLLPLVIDAAIALFLGIVAALPLMQVALLDGIVTLITTIVEMLPELLPMLLDAAIALFLGIVAALPVIMPKLTSAVIDLIVKIVTLIPTFVGALISAAVNLFTAIVNAVPKVMAGLKDAVGKLIEGAKDVLPEFASKFEAAGKDLISGIIAGVTASIGRLKDAVREAARKALDAAKDFLGIKSPSKVFALVGKAVMEGWEGGIADNTKAVVGAVADTAASMVDAAKASPLAQALAVSPGSGLRLAGYAPSLGTAGAVGPAGSTTTYYQIGDVSIPSSDPAAQQVFSDLMKLVKRYQRMVPMEAM